MKRILHVISGLERGGAETMLQKLLLATDRQRFTSEVVSLTPIGAIGHEIAGAGHPVTSLQQRRGVPSPTALIRMMRVIQRLRPDLIQTWLYHADLVGGISARLSGIPAVWNLRSGVVDRNVMRWTTFLTILACAKLSHRVPARIIACSAASHRVHADLGYDESKMRLIYNGFDLDAFRPDPLARAEVRAELGIDSNIPLFGLFGRYDPLKNHPMFIRAAAEILQQESHARFLLCGTGVTPENEAITGLISELGIADRMYLLGERRDMARITAAIDVACSTSYSEGFPNVLGEAMSAGVPCVVTDVGDSAMIVGDTGSVVPPRDAHAFATACVEMISRPAEERAELGRQCRTRIAANFSLEASVRRYEDLYDELIS